MPKRTRAAKTAKSDQDEEQLRIDRQMRDDFDRASQYRLNIIQQQIDSAINDIDEWFATYRLSLTKQQLETELKDSDPFVFFKNPTAPQPAPPESTFLQHHTVEVTPIPTVKTAAKTRTRRVETAMKSFVPRLPLRTPATIVPKVPRTVRQMRTLVRKPKPGEITYSVHGTPVRAEQGKA